MMELLEKGQSKDFGVIHELDSGEDNYGLPHEIFNVEVDREREDSDPKQSVEIHNKITKEWVYLSTNQVDDYNLYCSIKDSIYPKSLDRPIDDYNLYCSIKGSIYPKGIDLPKIYQDVCKLWDSIPKQNKVIEIVQDNRGHGEEKGGLKMNSVSQTIIDQQAKQIQALYEKNQKCGFFGKLTQEEIDFIIGTILVHANKMIIDEELNKKFKLYLEKINDKDKTLERIHGNIDKIIDKTFNTEDFIFPLFDKIFGFEGDAEK